MSAKLEIHQLHSYVRTKGARCPKFLRIKKLPTEKLQLFPKEQAKELPYAERVLEYGIDRIEDGDVLVCNSMKRNLEYFESVHVNVTGDYSEQEHKYSYDIDCVKNGKSIFKKHVVTDKFFGFLDGEGEDHKLWIHKGKFKLNVWKDGVLEFEDEKGKAIAVNLGGPKPALAGSLREAVDGKFKQVLNGPLDEGSILNFLEYVRGLWYEEIRLMDVKKVKLLEGETDEKVVLGVCEVGKYVLEHVHLPILEAKKFPVIKRYGEEKKKKGEVISVDDAVKILKKLVNTMDAVCAARGDAKKMMQVLLAFDEFKDVRNILEALDGLRYKDASEKMKITEAFKGAMKQEVVQSPNHTDMSFAWRASNSFASLVHNVWKNSIAAIVGETASLPLCAAACAAPVAYTSKRFKVTSSHILVLDAHAHVLASHPLAPGEEVSTFYYRMMTLFYLSKTGQEHAFKCISATSPATPPKILQKVDTKNGKFSDLDVFPSNQQLALYEQVNEHEHLHIFNWLGDVDTITKTGTVDATKHLDEVLEGHFDDEQAKEAVVGNNDVLLGANSDFYFSSVVDMLNKEEDYNTNHLQVVKLHVKNSSVSSSIVYKPLPIDIGDDHHYPLVLSFFHLSTPFFLLVDSNSMPAGSGFIFATCWKNKLINLTDNSRITKLSEAVMGYGYLRGEGIDFEYCRKHQQLVFVRQSRIGEGKEERDERNVKTVERIKIIL